MSSLLRFEEIQKPTTRNRGLLLVFTSYLVVLAIYVNLATFQSFIIGVGAAAIYCLINASFLGSAFFSGQNRFLGLALGLLLVVMLLGFIGWLAMILYNLDAPKCALVLLVVSTLSYVSHRSMKSKNAE